MFLTTKYIVGSFFHAPVKGEFEYHESAIIGINDDGIIESITLKEDKDYANRLEVVRNSDSFYEAKEGEYLIPGFIDLHIHAPQWPQSGVALDDDLNVWLNECTFPLESKYKDLQFSKKVYKNLVQTLLAHGTTTAMYFGTIYNDSNMELVKQCAKLGQRGLVGKVVMDDKAMNPDFYVNKDTKTAILDTEKFIKDVVKYGQDVKQGVYPVVTPRFVPSCTSECLKELGKLAKKYDVHIQSHCCEGQWENDFVIEKYDKTDPQVLESFGLLTDKSVMAHAVFLDEEGGEIFKKHNSSVVHCPISNSYFANAVLLAKKLSNQGVNISMGTDISGGFSPSMYHNIRHSVMVSRMLEDGVDFSIDFKKRGVKSSRISVLDAFYFATTAGAKAIKMPLGLIEVGKVCDLQLIRMKHGFDLFCKPKDILSKILYLTEKTDIKKVWVQGSIVHEKGENHGKQ